MCVHIYIYTYVYVPTYRPTYLLIPAYLLALFVSGLRKGLVAQWQATPAGSLARLLARTSQQW